MRWAVYSNGTTYYGWSNKSDAYDWAARNLNYEFKITQLIRIML